MKCEICGSDLKLRTKLSGSKQGLRYWVCSEFPACSFKKGYAEQGDGSPWKWFLDGGKFIYRQIKGKS
jgi:ssDNA-binding Zn-finger/Zn-ribbon topoisomerase 1